MNNYLASIVARTLNPVPSVRPRLSGRFELDSDSRERSISRPELVRPTAPARVQAHTVETTEQHDSQVEAKKSFDRTPHLEQSAAPTPEVGPGAALPSKSLLSSSTVPPTQQKIIESPSQNIHVEVRPLEKALDSQESNVSGSEPLPEFRQENRSGVPLTESHSRSEPPDHRAADKQAASTLSRVSIRTSEPVLSDEPEPIGQTSIEQPLITHQKSVIERELETIIIREKPITDETARLRQSQFQLAPMSVAALTEGLEDEGSKAAPIIVQSRIAPVIDTAPEQLYFNRPSNTPQPTIQVTIGRIEVRAVQTSQSPAKLRAATPVMNLDDYLMRRGQGGAR
ncbi:MAG TPA: hypothetical protein VLB68_16920 [Pyrinomonadaceae bacterium]|nr:hypothetical protein [Pyrinomonadaceae bacterium]